jgi:hypothetical protein
VDLFGNGGFQSATNPQSGRLKSAITGVLFSIQPGFVAASMRKAAHRLSQWSNMPCTVTLVTPSMARGAALSRRTKKAN